MSNISEIAALPVVYSVKGQMIPAGLTLVQRKTFAQGLGVPAHAAMAIAVQDRASSIMSQLLLLLDATDGTPQAARAKVLVLKWNTECDKAFCQ